MNRTHVEGMNLLGTQQVIQTAPTGTNIVITRWSSCDKKNAEEKMKIGRTIKGEFFYFFPLIHVIVSRVLRSEPCVKVPMSAESSSFGTVFPQINSPEQLS